MATQTVEFRSPPSQTVTAKLFTVGSDTEQASVSATEATNRKGTYSAAFTDEAAGEYELIAFVGAVPVARWFVTLTLTTATFQTYDKVRAELDPTSRAAILTQELIESYAADGAAPTVAQALMMLLQHHQQKSVSGTTVTIKKLDKSTTAGTYTLDSATDPTSITRAT